MTRRSRPYLITKPAELMLLERKGKNICFKCKNKIKIGDTIHRQLNAYRLIRVYHEECWESVRY